MASIVNIEKRKRGRPATDATPVMVRLPPDLLGALDTSIAANEEKWSRPDAVRHALRDWLVSHGYLKHRERPEGAS